MVRSLILALALYSAALPAAAQQGARVHVVNALSVPRTGELVEIPWSDLTRVAPSLTPSEISVTDSSTGKELPVQVIDREADGAPDFLLVQTDVPAASATTLTVVPSPARRVFPPLTDAQFELPREDFAWENDRVAFRMYGPALAKEVDNGIDVWTKRVRSLIVQKWYKAAETAPPGHDPYHEDHGEGADFFAVGRTLGAGGCAILNADTLMQPGVFKSYRVIATGPLRAVFALTYNPVQAGGRLITQRMRIAIDAGANLNRIDVTFDADGPPVRIPFAAGIVKRKGVTSRADSGYGTGSLWGLTTGRPEEGFLGTGIVMAQPAFSGVRDTPVHLLITGTATTGTAATYYAGAGWTRSGDFATEADWFRYLREGAMKLRTPLRVTVAAIR